MIALVNNEAFPGVADLEAAVNGWRISNHAAAHWAIVAAINAQGELLNNTCAIAVAHSEGERFIEILVFS